MCVSSVSIGSGHSRPRKFFRVVIPSVMLLRWRPHSPFVEIASIRGRGFADVIDALMVRRRPYLAPSWVRGKRGWWRSPSSSSSIGVGCAGLCWALPQGAQSLSLLLHRSACFAICAGAEEVPRRAACVSTSCLILTQLRHLKWLRCRYCDRMFQGHFRSRVSAGGPPPQMLAFHESLPNWHALDVLM